MNFHDIKAEIAKGEGLGSGVTNINKYLPLYANGAKPVFQDGSNGFELTIPLATEGEDTTPKTTGQAAGQVTGQAAGQVTDEVLHLLKCLDKPMSRKELQGKLGLKSRSNFMERYLLPALKDELVEMTQPDSPNSPRQRYRLTEKGAELK